MDLFNLVKKEPDDDTPSRRPSAASPSVRRPSASQSTHEPEVLVIQDSPTRKRERSKDTTGFWSDGRHYFCELCHPNVGQPSSRASSGKGGTGVKGRLGLETSAFGLRSHREKCTSVAPSQSQLSGTAQMKKLFNPKTRAEEDRDLWAWAVVDCSLPYSLFTARRSERL